MNIAKFVILGILDQYNTASGYDILQAMQKKMVHRWTDIKKGSIYHALKQLEKEQAIRVAQRVRSTTLPEKTLFSITAHGESVFDTLQEQAFLGLFPHFYGFKLALKFNVRKSSAEIQAYAQQAIQRIDAQLHAMQAYLNTLDPNSAQFAFDQLFIDHDVALYRAEKRWIRSTVRRLPQLQPLLNSP